MQTINNLSTTKYTKIQAELSTKAWENLILKRRTSNSVENLAQYQTQKVITKRWLVCLNEKL